MSPAKIAIAWSGLPPYAASSIAQVLKAYPGKVCVLGTHADVPHKGLESMIGKEVHWLKREQRYSWQDLGLEIPDVYIHTGWAYPCFNSLGAEVKSNRGLRCSMIDSIWYGRFKQLLGLLYFRLVYRQWFDAVIVPGKMGRRFCHRMGMPHDRIFEGLYGASDEIFSPGPALNERPKRILFVGRLIERKGVLQLLDAARQSHERGDGWEFVLIGSGPLESYAKSEPAVRVEPFGSPEVIADWMRTSRFLVLPSVEENWGVVVHEAALCGCGLILAEGVGAGADLLCPENGIEVTKGSSEALNRAFAQLAEWDFACYDSCEARSLELAAGFGPKAYASAIASILRIT
jgi:glycosyltransferase involved in cell wall biosynthesis